MTVDLSTRTVRAVAAVDDDPRDYFVVADGHLLRTTGRGPEADVVCALPDIQEVGGPGRWEGEPLELRLTVHGPWVCVTERLGQNAALVDTVTGTARALSRGTYHEDVSSYSVGFLERDGRTLLICQTDWNRLDVYDAATWDHLTARDMTQETQETNERGETRVVPGKNFSWLFHSSLHVSPGSRHFLGQGWVWSPQDKVAVYATDDFLEGWEPSGMLVDGRGCNWDRPATFVDDETFVLALDDLLAGEHLDEEDEAGYEYEQLGIFTIPSPLTPGRESRWLQPTARVACDVFPVGAEGEVVGELHLDPVTGHLVALNARGAFLVRLDGTVVEHLPDVTGAARSVFDHAPVADLDTGWWYDRGRRRFYRWRDGAGVEERAFSETGSTEDSPDRPDDGATGSATARPR